MTNDRNGESSLTPKYARLTRGWADADAAFESQKQQKGRDMVDRYSGDPLGGLAGQSIDDLTRVLNHLLNEDELDFKRLTPLVKHLGTRPELGGPIVRILRHAAQSRPEFRDLYNTFKNLRWTVPAPGDVDGQTRSSVD